MGWYTPVDVAPDLARVLACSWSAVPSGRHRLVPDGCADLLWVRQSPTGAGVLWLCGPEVTAWTFALPPGSEAVGVRFLPGLVGVVLDTDVSALAHRRVTLSSIVGDTPSAELISELDASTSTNDRIQVLEGFIRAHIYAGAPCHDSFVDQVLEHVTVSRVPDIGELASSLAMTTRQLHRRSLLRFGYGVATLARLLRFQRFLALSQAPAHARGTATTLASLAATAGYSDHAHLIRDCRAITGMAPGKFLATYFPTFPNMSDPYKTIVPLAVSMAQ